MRLRRYPLLVVLALALALVGPGTALAQGPGVNVLKLRAADGVQPGSLLFYEWTARSGPGTCLGLSADGTGDFPDALDVAAGPQQLTVRIRHRRPAKVVVRAWTEGNGNNPAGDAEKLPVDLVRHDPADRSRGWDAVLDADVGGDLFLSVYARWKNHSGCAGPRHLVKYFHLAGV